MPCWAAEGTEKPMQLKAKHSQAMRAKGGWSTQSACEESEVKAVGESLGLKPSLCHTYVDTGTSVPPK